MRPIPRCCLKILACCVLAAAAAPAFASDFTLTPVFDGTSFSYFWSVNIGAAAAQKNPTLFLARGQSYSFTANTTTLHPFYFKTVSSIGTMNAYSDGVSAALPVTSATPLTFNVPLDAPEKLFYNCGNHSTMAGTIEVVVFRNGFD